MSSTPPDPALDPMAPVGPVDYRLSPVLVVRLLGLYVLVLAVVLVLATVLLVVLDGDADVLVVLVLAGLAGLAGLAWWLRSRAYVVRLTDDGYRVRLIRGAGAAEGVWGDVAEAVAGQPQGIACLVLRRKDATSTTVPVDALAADRDDFARDVRGRLQRAVRR